MLAPHVLRKLRLLCLPCSRVLSGLLAKGMRLIPLLPGMEEPGGTADHSAQTLHSGTVQRGQEGESRAHFHEIVSGYAAELGLEAGFSASGLGPNAFKALAESRP